jgi:hypothetical protein
VGGQVNLWIEGRSFPDNVEVKFNTPEIDVAYVNNEPIPDALRVRHNTASSRGYMDGIYYKIRISPLAPLGPVEITIKDPTTGSTLTADRLFEIVPRGEGLNLNQEGAVEIESVTGASPVAVRAGSDSAMWVYGQGFNLFSEIRYSVPTIQEAQPSEAVISAANWPGYDGFRSYLRIPANTPVGPVDVTVKNPNNSTATKMAAFEVFPSNGAPIVGGGGGAPVPECNEDDSDLYVQLVGQMTPNIIQQGETVTVSLAGMGFGCSPLILITGLGGVEMLSPAYRSPDPINPALQNLNFTIRVAANAPPGPRSVTVVNPNMSQQHNPQAFTVVAADDGPACSTSASGAHSWPLMILFALLGLMRVSRDRVSSAR